MIQGCHKPSVPYTNIYGTVWRVEAGTRAIAYARVSTSEQGASGLGLHAQEAAIRCYCDQRQWILHTVYHEVASGAKDKRRPILDDALTQLAKGDVLVVAKADRLARSLSAYVRLIERARTDGWAIVSADGSIDLTTPHGRAMSAMAAVFGELEAELIGDRTRVALAAAKQRGKRLGRPPEPLPADVVAEIKQRRESGESLHRIAAALNDAGTPSPTGGRWYAPAVARVASR
jgi:DNA invertase Pin-like site-specific DNA recombinase